MNDRAFRLDFLIAIGALLVSALTAATLIYQTRVIGQQFSATIWPYISIEETLDPSVVQIDVRNDGLGPALIGSAQLSVDGKNVPGWSAYLDALATQPKIRELLFVPRSAHQPWKLSLSSIGSSSTIRPGNDQILFRLAFDNMSLDPQLLAAHTLAVDLCYCSLNDSCWNLHWTSSTAAVEHPHTVSRCESSSSIVSTLRPPSVPRRER